MKRLYYLALLFISGPLWAGAGGQAALQVSSGTFRAISIYDNDDGAGRQAIILGNRTSSATLTVDPIIGITVNLATSTAAGIGSLSAGTAEIGNVKNSGTFAVQSTAVNVGTVTISGTPTVSANSTNVNTSTVTFNGTTQPVYATNVGTVTISGTPTVTANATIVNTSTVTFNGTTQPVYLTNVATTTVSGTVAATQSGTWTVQPGNTANSTAWFVNPFSITTIGDGLKLVTTAGTRVALAGSTACKIATVCSDPANTGVMVVGGTSVVAAAGTRQGVPLSPGDCYTVQIDNLSDINIDSTVSLTTATYSYQN